MLRIFKPVKIQRLRPGLNPQTWVPEYTVGTGSFLRVKRPRRGFDHPPHLAPRLKKEYTYTSTPTIGLRGLFQVELYLYLYTLLTTSLILRFPFFILFIIVLLALFILLFHLIFYFLFTTSFSIPVSTYYFSLSHLSLLSVRYQYILTRSEPSQTLPFISYPFPTCLSFPVTHPAPLSRGYQLRGTAGASN